MEQAFEKFLIAKSYKQYTPSGNPSTVYDYLKRIDFVTREERCSWLDLANNINNIRTMYEPSGKKAKMGAKSHNAVICALRQFQIFVQSQKTNNIQ